MTRMTATLCLLVLTMIAPAGAVVVITPEPVATTLASGATKMPIADAAVATFTDPRTLLTISLGLGIVGLVGRASRQPRTVAV